ncbi:MAG: hypothetical protein JWO30_97 [Fibrobacteres bacterium]|nr:hypothetical protein [Fibrobacterota bacterium]
MSMKSPLRARAIGFLFAALALIVLACGLAGNENTDQTFSFTKSYDELAQFDSVQIVLKDTSGHTLDNLYRGKVDTVREIEQLKAIHWKGGIAVISIIGYQGGEIVYKVEKRFNGANDQVLDTLRLILPGTTLSIDGLELQMTEGDSVSFPKITVTPVELSDKSLSFASSAPQLLQVGPTYLRALQRGTAKLTATLKSNPGKSLVFNVTILPNPLTPDSLFLTPDTLRLAAGGSAGSLAVKVSPASADTAVTWSLKDSTIARITGPGIIEGVKQGATVAFAISKRRPALLDSSIILVSSPVAVKEVKFQSDSLDLFVGGAAESLSVNVLPALANPKVAFEVMNPALVSLIGSRVQGLAEGTTGVIARSTENPAAADTLKVVIFPTQKIDSVRLSLDTLKLFTGAPGATLTPKVYPLTSNPSLLWRSQNPAVATVDGAGKVSPVSPGKTLVIAFSRVDSTRQDTAIVLVKRDMPQVSVGRDTVIPLGTSLSFRPQVTQEYGSVVQFRWDLNGDGTWDGTSDSIKTVSYTYAEAKEVVAAFSIKDTEGNDTTVTRKIKVVAGPAVQILSPKDSTYTRLFTIDVTWSVNAKEQDSLKKQTLKLGVNTVTRSAKDESGNLYSASITVIVDTTPPNKPLVHGPATTASKTPTWTWASGGGGGAGTYKYWLDVDDSSKGKQIKDTTYTPPTELTEGVHTLFVAESDLAGNWSVAGKLAIKIDVTVPGTPLVAVTPASPTNVRKPKWIWATGGNGGIGAYQYKLDNGNLATGATATTDTTFTPAANLANGSHTLYVQEKDSTGNWSASGSATISIDTIAPNAPVVTSTTASPTNNTMPTWNWTSGGGGKGIYRYKVGDTVWASSGSQGNGTTYTASALAEGDRTLFVEEQDSAGNWSTPGSKIIRIDLTPPGVPTVSSPGLKTISLKPTWSWTSAGSGGGGYRVKLDNSDFTSGSTTVSGSSFAPTSNQSEGTHTLYVQESDSAGNWSGAGSASTFIYGQTGYAAGGGVYKTTNGGVTWVKLPTITDDISAAYFTDRDTGYAVGGSGLILKTSDGGNNWSLPQSGLDSNLHYSCVFFPTKRNGYAASATGLVVKTTNAGNTWSSTTSGTPLSLGSIHFTDASTGYTTGYGGDGDFGIFKTGNGGDSWDRVGSLNAYGGAVYFTNASTGYVVLDGGTIVKTTNAGAKWDTLPHSDISHLLAVHFPDNNNGYAAGYVGAILKTTNAGAKWTVLNSNTTENIRSLFFLDASVGYAGGDNGLITMTVDGGATWSQQNTPTAGAFNSIQFP